MTYFRENLSGYPIRQILICLVCRFAVTGVLLQTESGRDNHMGFGEKKGCLIQF